MIQDDFYHCFLNTNYNGQTYQAPAGRLWVSNGSLEILEDPYEMWNLLPTGPIDDATMAVLGGRSGQLSIVSHSDLINGHSLDFIPERQLAARMYQYPEVDPTQIQQAAEGNCPEHAIFHYTRVGHDTPQMLESHSTGECFLNGHPLSPEEQEVVLTNVANGLATLQHLNTLGKSEIVSDYGNLANKQILEDPRVPGMGNKYAFQQTEPSLGQDGKPNWYALIDINDQNAINAGHGHSIGDKLVSAIGKAIQAAANEAAPNRFKCYAIGGDEFGVEFEDEADSHHFAKILDQKVAAMEPIGATNKPSIGIGLAPDPDLAAQALYAAKTKKNQYLAQGGQSHSIPNFISTHSEIMQNEASAPDQKPESKPEAPGSKETSNAL